MERMDEIRFQTDPEDVPEMAGEDRGSRVGEDDETEGVAKRTSQRAGRTSNDRCDSEFARCR